MKRLAVAAAVVAALDISFAATYWVVIRGTTTFPRILQSIAAGMIGRGAMTGGTPTVLLGALIHCCVALAWTAVFLVALRRWPGLARTLNKPFGALKLGVPYGMCVWLVMNFVVIGLSRSNPTPLIATWFWVSLVWHAAGVGLPIAMIMREAQRQ